MPLRVLRHHVLTVILDKDLPLVRVMVGEVPGSASVGLGGLAGDTEVFD